MAPFFLVGHTIPSKTPPDPDPKEQQGQKPSVSVVVKSLGLGCHCPRWMRMAITTILVVIVAGLCIAGIIFLIDYSEERYGNGGFIDRSHVYFAGDSPATQGYRVGSRLPLSSDQDGHVDN